MNKQMIDGRVEAIAQEFTISTSQVEQLLEDAITKRAARELESVIAILAADIYYFQQQEVNTHD